MGNFRIFKDFQWVSLVKLPRKPIENPWNSKNVQLFQDFELFKIIFWVRKKNVFFETIFLKSKICPGIQKSYLENRVSIFKLFKTKNPVFPTQISGILYSVTYTDPQLFHWSRSPQNRPDLARIHRVPPLVFFLSIGPE